MDEINNDLALCQEPVWNGLADKNEWVKSEMNHVDTSLWFSSLGKTCMHVNWVAGLLEEYREKNREETSGLWKLIWPQQPRASTKQNFGTHKRDKALACCRNCSSGWRFIGQQDRLADDIWIEPWSYTTRRRKKKTKKQLFFQLEMDWIGNSRQMLLSTWFPKSIELARRSVNFVFVQMTPFLCLQSFWKILLSACGHL